MDEGEEIPEFEDHPCPFCGGMIQVVKMDFRFAGRYTCPHCGKDLLLSDEPGQTCSLTNNIQRLLNELAINRRNLH